MPDYLIRGTAMDGFVRAFAARTTKLVEQLRERHDTWATATAAFGRTLTVGAMMGAMLQDEQKLTIQVKGNGPLGPIVVDANAAGEVRGYVEHPHVHLPSNAQGKLDVAGAVGKEGTIYITKDLGLKEPYRGSIPIISGELGEDFTYYFAASEQIPSAVAVGVLVNNDHSVRTAGGFIIQMLPGASDDHISHIEQKLSTLAPITELLESGITLEALLADILPGFRKNDESAIIFRCQCSRERVEQTLISLGRDEISDIIQEEGQAELVCQFCNEVYQFGRDDLEQLRQNNFS